jgi:hypothetical protein
MGDLNYIGRNKVTTVLKKNLFGKILDKKSVSHYLFGNKRSLSVMEEQTV